jgi:hypothetical protein
MMAAWRSTPLYLAVNAISEVFDIFSDIKILRIASCRIYSLI